MPKIRIEKRIPFGFKGAWGKVYKVTTFTQNEHLIEYQCNNYIDLGEDVQFKYLENGIDKSISLTQPIMNLPTNSEYRVVKTTDAFYNDEIGEYECVVGINDIIFLFGKYWIVDKMDERSIFTPNKQTFYYCGLKRIFDAVIKEKAKC